MSSCNRFVISTGNYDWLHRNEKRSRITFYVRADAPEAIKTGDLSFTFDEWFAECVDRDTEPADAAQLALYETRKYIYYGGKEYLVRLTEYLESMRDQDRRDVLLVKKEELEKKLSQVNDELIKMGEMK